MAPKVPNVVFNNGLKCPVFGLGTWNSKPGEVTQAVRDAIDCGYRHIDCAYIYGNEPEIGVALREKMQEKVVKREELFITSKLWNTFHSPELVEPAVQKSLKNLGLAYLDMYLIHWPMGYQEGGETFPKDENNKFLYSDVDYVKTWVALEECVKSGLIRSIGFSNFNKAQVERVLKIATVKPVNLQVECHPYLNQKKLLDYCKSRDMKLTAYSPLGSPKRPMAKPDDPVIIEEPKVISIAEKYKKTPAQILIKYQLQRGAIVIPKSVTKSRIESNIEVFDFELTPADVATIDSFDCNTRLLNLNWVNDHEHFPFHDEC